jgi:flagellar export protein FliJ
LKKFDFRLRRVLDIRALQEKVKLTELGRERSKLADEERKLELFKRESDSQLEQIRNEQSREFPTWSQQANLRYLTRLSNVIRFQQNSVSTQSDSVTRVRGEFTDARKRTESLERMQEKKLSEWKQDAIKEEGKRLDEHGARRQSTGESS